MRISNRLDKHLAIAATAVAGIVASSDAAIVHFANQNRIINSDFNGLYLNVVTGAYNTTGGSGSSVTGGWHVNPYGSTGLTWFQSAPNSVGYVVTGTAMSNLAAGTAIGASSTFGTGPASTNLTLNGLSLIGFRFNLNGNTHYGWLRLSLGATYGGQPRSVVDWAFEDTAGASIAAGAIPAPGAIALLGLAGFAGRRRR